MLYFSLNIEKWQAAARRLPAENFLIECNVWLDRYIFESARISH